jgi:hypothetical protein
VPGCVASQSRASSSPNDKDKLPGRLQDLHAARNQDSGPVSFIRWFAGGLLAGDPHGTL